MSVKLVLDRVARHVGFDLVHVEAERLGDLEGRRLVGLALRAEHGLMEFPVLALALGGERDAGGFFRALRQDRQLLEDEADLLVVLDQPLHFGQPALAVAAVEIEEFDDGDIAIGIAGDGAVRAAKDRLAVLRP